MLKFRTLAAVSALSLMATAPSQAALIGASASGGSEATANFINTANNQSYSLDLGAQIAAILDGTGTALNGTPQYTLPTGLVNFITGAGASLRFSVVAGSQASATAAGTYLSTGSAIGPTLANAVRGTWLSTLNAFLIGASGLNSINSADTDTAVNSLYGPLDSGSAGNYLTGTGTDFMADWGTAGACASSSCNLGALGSLTTNLYKVAFGTSPTGSAVLTNLGSATIDLANGKLTLGAAAVPAPGVAWLAAAAFGLVGVRFRRSVR